MAGLTKYDSPLCNLIELACLWEATVPKPGNVHPGASFVDTCYDDFVRSAHAIGPVFEHASSRSVGELVLEAVQATRQAVGKNTNLGIILVLAPLAQGGDETGVLKVLERLTIRDADLVYQAIRLAQPGGLGQAAEEDVHTAPTVTLRDAMKLAADRDLIARQYAQGYREIFHLLLPCLEAALRQGSPQDAILETYLQGLAQLGDTLIGRKCGLEVMLEAQHRAQQVLGAGPSGSSTRATALADYDAWLRADGHRRNPGTMADLLAGTIYLALRRGSMAARPPAEIPETLPNP